MISRCGNQSPDVPTQNHTCLLARALRPYLLKSVQFFFAKVNLLDEVWNAPKCKLAPLLASLDFATKSCKSSTRKAGDGPQPLFPVVSSLGPCPWFPDRCLPASLTRKLHSPPTSKRLLQGIPQTKETTRFEHIHPDRSDSHQIARPTSVTVSEHCPRPHPSPVPCPWPPR
jgi:hypothetical protein